MVIHRPQFYLLLTMAVLGIVGAILNVPPTCLIAQAAQGPGNFLQVEGGKIYYEECGGGDEAVLLVHDGVVHSAVWDDVWPDFCKAFHIIRYDRRGYGRSPVATAWHTETDDILALLHRLKIRRAMIVGSSHGGELSIEFTIEHPELVEELILVGPVVHGYPYSDHFLNRGEATWGSSDNPNDIAKVITRIANDRYLTAPDHAAARKRIHDLLTAAPQDVTHSNMARNVPSSLPRLHEIHAPTLILVGDADIPDVHAHAGAIETGIPNARRIVVPDTGHLMYLEKPGEFTHIVMDFLQLHREKL